MADVFPVDSPLYYDAAGNLREAVGVRVVPDAAYLDAAGNVRGAIGVNIVGGGGGELLPTQAIIDDEQQIIATNGQTISVAVADNVPSLTIKNWAFWEPFTVTCGEFSGAFGYFAGEGIGSITNEPVSGFTLNGATLNIDGTFELVIVGPKNIGGEIEGALIGIGAETYSPTRVQTYFDPSGFDGCELMIEVDSVSPAWTVDQQVPIVIIPQ